MNYIINPSWFYWLEVVEALKTVFIVCAITINTVAVIFIIFDSGEDMISSKKTRTIMAVIGILAIFPAILVPSKQTMIEMMVAKFATYENAQWTVDAVKDAVDYIVQAIKSIG